MSDEDNELAAGLHSIARALRDLGNADAGTPMGAIEAHGGVMKEGIERVSVAIDDAGESIANAIDGFSASLDKLTNVLEEFLNRTVPR